MLGRLRGGGLGASGGSGGTPGRIPGWTLPPSELLSESLELSLVSSTSSIMKCPWSICTLTNKPIGKYYYAPSSTAIAFCCCGCSGSRNAGNLLIIPVNLIIL